MNLSDLGWQVRFQYDASRDMTEWFVFRRVADGWREFLQSGERGAVVVHRIDRNATIEPFIAFPGTIGREIMIGIAGELARSGYGALEAAPQVKALERHIDSLEKQADRLFQLKAGA